MSFASDVAKFGNKVNTRMDVVVRKITFDLTSSIVLKTPVDTGLARSNWQVGIGSRPSGTRATLDKSGGSSITEAAQVTASIKAGGVCYIVNNLPYIMALEYGHSKQASAGMARISVARFQAIANAAVRSVQ